MDDDRFCEVVAIIANFDLEEPTNWLEIPELRVEVDRYRTTLGQLRSTLREEFPEWHFPDGEFVGNYKRYWGIGDSMKSKDGLHCLLREAWELASTGETDSASGRLFAVSQHFRRRAKKAQGRKKEVLTLMVETLEWLGSKVKSLKVCENPQCSKFSKYFFRVYNNDRYCCRGCGVKAKALRQSKRDAESKTPPRVPKFSDKTRSKMSLSAILRHANERANKGKNKSGRP